MSEIEELRREVATLRKNLDNAVRLIRWEARQRALIENYLETLSSTRGQGAFERRLNSWLPLWGWFHPLRVLVREPFKFWAEREAEKRDDCPETGTAPGHSMKGTK